VIGGLGELVCEQAKTRDDRGPTPIGRFEREKVHLKGVAGFGTMDSDGAADLIDAVEVELQELWHAAAGIELATAGVEQVELDDGARLDGGNRLDRRIPGEVVSIAGDMD
jgi:hypothetical protein